MCESNDANHSCMNNVLNYLGLLDSPDGHVFVYSLSDPQSTTTPTTSVLYSVPESITVRVGKEFRFLTTNLYRGKWVPLNEYIMITRCWDDGQHTSFGLWVFNSAYWDYLVTLDYPYKRARFNSETVAFMNNYGSTQLTGLRKMIIFGGWKRSTTGWDYFQQGTFNVGTNGGALPNYGDFYVASKLGLTANINSANSVQTVLFYHQSFYFN